MPTTTTSATLWSDSARSRYFVIPDDETLPAGEFTLWTITGSRKDVDAAALAPFEVAEAQAKDWLAGQFGQLLDSARGAVDRFVDTLRGASDDPLVIVREPIEQLERAIARLSVPVSADAASALADRLAACEARLRKLARRDGDGAPQFLSGPS